MFLIAPFPDNCLLVPLYGFDFRNGFFTISNTHSFFSTLHRADKLVAVNIISLELRMAEQHVIVATDSRFRGLEDYLLQIHIPDSSTTTVKVIPGGSLLNCFHSVKSCVIRVKKSNLPDLPVSLTVEMFKLPTCAAEKVSVYLLHKHVSSKTRFKI